METDLELAFRLVDLADAQTLHRWSASGVESTTKSDGTPVTEADSAAEMAMLEALRGAHPEDGFLGEEVGEHPGTSGRRWIADGIDGTRFYAAGEETWGTLLALEVEGTVVLGVASSPVLDRRWWAEQGAGAATGRSDGSDSRRITVSQRNGLDLDRLVCLPSIDSLSPGRQHTMERLAGGRPADRPWSHQLLVAEGGIDMCIWFAGDVWDHAAPSIIVEEAGGRFTDHSGGKRLDTRTAVYSNGTGHDEVLAALAST